MLKSILFVPKIFIKRNFSVSILSVVDKLNSKPLVLKGEKDWEKNYGKKLVSDNVIITMMGDIHPNDNGPIIECNSVIIKNCNKNFVYYWLNNKTFPQVENIFLLSHPCDKKVFSRWESVETNENKKSIPNIFLSHRYIKYKIRWAKKLDNVSIAEDIDEKILKEKTEN